LLGTIIGAVAPFLGKMIGLGGSTSKLAVKAVSGVLGVDIDDPEALDTALEKATPDQVAEIQRIDAEYKVSLARLEVDDRKSARNRQIQLKDNFPSYLGSFLIVGFFVIIVVMMMKSIPTDNGELLDALIGALAAMASSAVFYFFGGGKK